MYFKITKSKDRHYLKIVQAYREAGKVKHKIIANLGGFDHLAGNSQLIGLGKRLLSIAQADSVSLTDMVEQDRLCYGDTVYQKLWNKYDFTDLLTAVCRGKKNKYSLAQIIYLLVIDRLLNPRSKLGCFANQDKYININQVPLHTLYRSLDVMAKAKHDVEDHIYSKQRNLFNCRVDVVLYDVTTYHFESIRADELKEFGYSKAGKVNEVQVVMGLLVDTEGHPIGYDLFPGNTFDGNTLLSTLSKLKQRYSIRKLVIVADKGINSAENLYNISEAGYQYIVSSRIKNASVSIQNAIFNNRGFKTINKDDEGNVTFKHKTIKEHTFIYKDEQGQSHILKDNLIISWSKTRADKDKTERERMIRKAKDMIDNNTLPDDKRGFKRYIATKGKKKLTGLDEEKIKNDQRWDGLYGIQTNQIDMNNDQIIEAYHQLWKIENAFRLLKTTMRTRPVFHWTPQRIKGHFVVCFIAFVLERAMESKLKRNKINASPQKIKEAINSLEVSKIALGNQQYYLKGKQHKLASEILRVFKIKQINNITHIKEFSKTPLQPVKTSLKPVKSAFQKV